MDQEAFDEAFETIVGEHALDDVIERLAAIGVVVEPWQRPILEAWLEGWPEKASLRVRVEACADLARQLREPR